MSDFIIFIGGIDHTESLPINPTFSSSSNISDYTNLPILGGFPIYDSIEKITSVYSTSTFCLTNDRTHSFNLIFSNEKASFAIATNISVILVPRNLVENERLAITGRTTGYELDRKVIAYNAGISFSSKAHSDADFMADLFNTLKDRIESIANVLVFNNIAFDMVAIDEKTGKKKCLSQKTKALKINAIHQSKKFTFDLEQHVIGIGGFNKLTPKIITSAEIIKKMGVLHNHFLDKHFLFKRFGEIDLGVSKAYPTKTHTKNKRKKR